MLLRYENSLQCYQTNYFQRMQVREKPLSNKSLIQSSYGIFKVIEAHAFEERAVCNYGNYTCEPRNNLFFQKAHCHKFYDKIIFLKQILNTRTKPSEDFLLIINSLLSFGIKPVSLISYAVFCFFIKN